MPAILRAVAEKLIPGIPIPTRISILQQTATDEAQHTSTGGGSSQSQSTPTAGSQLSVLAEVIDRATSRNEIQREIDGEEQYSVNLIYSF